MAVKIDIEILRLCKMSEVAKFKNLKIWMKSLRKLETDIQNIQSNKSSS